MSENSDNSDPLRRTPKKFGLMWLLGVTTILAIVFSFAFDPKTPGNVNPQEPLWKILFGISSVSVGIISLAGASFVIQERFSNQRWWPHPGYTLFLILASSYLTTEVSEKILRLVWNELLVDPNTPSLFAMGFLYVQAALLLFRAAICWLGITRDRFWWRIVFILLALSELGSFFRIAINLLAAYQIVSVSPMDIGRISIAMATVTGCGVLALVCASLIDLCRKLKRDRIHWCGVIGMLWFYTIPTVLAMVASRYLSVQQMLGVE